MVLKLFYLFRLENHFAYSGIMGESIWQEDTPNTNPMGHWIRSVLLRSLGLSQHFSFHGRALLWGSKQAVCTRRLSHWTAPCAPFSSLASPCYVEPSWFARRGPVHGLRRRTPSLSEHQNHLRNVNLQLWGSTPGVLVQGVYDSISQDSLMICLLRASYLR